jgi:hypothetical protein
MVTYALVLALGSAGYLKAPAWLVLAGVACLTLEGWRPWRSTRTWGPQSRIDWTSKTTTYFVTGVVANLILASAAFAGGRIVRALLGSL